MADVSSIFSAIVSFNDKKLFLTYAVTLNLLKMWARNLIENIFSLFSSTFLNFYLKNKIKEKIKKKRLSNEWTSGK